MKNLGHNGALLLPLQLRDTISNRLAANPGNYKIQDKGPMGHCMRKEAVWYATALTGLERLYSLFILLQIFEQSSSGKLKFVNGLD